MKRYTKVVEKIITQMHHFAISETNKIMYYFKNLFFITHKLKILRKLNQQND